MRFKLKEGNERKYPTPAGGRVASAWCPMPSNPRTQARNCALRAKRLTLQQNKGPAAVHTNERVAALLLCSSRWRGFAEKKKTDFLKPLELSDSIVKSQRSNTPRKYAVKGQTNSSPPPPTRTKLGHNRRANGRAPRYSQGQGHGGPKNRLPSTRTRNKTNINKKIVDYHELRFQPLALKFYTKRPTAWPPQRTTSTLGYRTCTHRKPSAALKHTPSRGH